MSGGLLNSKELSEFKDVVKHIGSIAKSLQQSNLRSTKEVTLDRQHIDAINKLNDTIKTSTDAFTNSIDALTKAIIDKK